MALPIRILTAVPICDGHDSAINTINLEFIRHGIEVVYLGFHRYVGDIVRAAIQEDVAAIGISSYNGGHIDFFADVVSQLKKNGANDIAVFGGGGGTITHDDARQMKRKGVDEIFFAGTSLTQMADYVKKHYGKRKKRRVKSKPDLALARKLTELEEAASKRGKHQPSNDASPARTKDRTSKVIGFTFSSARQQNAHRNFIARPERDRRRCLARRSRHHDQLAGRSGVYAQHGH